MTTLHIRQDAQGDGRYRIRLIRKRAGQPDQEAEASIQFALAEQEQEDLRWYLEDYLQRARTVEPVTVAQVELVMKTRGEELYTKVLACNGDTQALWFSIRNDLADLRVEISTGVAEAASIPWELMCDPKMDSPISLRVKSFVRVQSNPNIAFVAVPPTQDDQIRLLYIVCRPSGARDVELRAVANRLLQDLGPDRTRFDIKALRPPTFEQLQQELTNAKEAGRPYHIVHFDGHGIYDDLGSTRLAAWLSSLSSLTLGGGKPGKHGYLLFEHDNEDKVCPVDGQTLGQLLHDSGVPILVLNACQSAMHEVIVAPRTAAGVHDEVRAIGSLAQAVIDQGIPAVLGMRYSVYVVTAAQYIGQLYAALAKGRSFGQAATEGRKHLHLNPDRWVGLQPRLLQDWFVPIAYEASPIALLDAGVQSMPGPQSERDPVQRNRALLRYVPEEGFIGRDETLLALDRAFDRHRVVLLHAFAGQGKSSTAVEFARWFALTGGLGEQPLVLFASFEGHTDLDDLLNQIGQAAGPLLESKGIQWSATNDPDRRRELVLRLLRRVPLLWIWDNVEPVAGFPEGSESQWTSAEQEALRDFLKQLKLDSASRVKLLLTSRRDETKWLGGIPHRIAMPRMRDADAAKLALRLGEERCLQHSEISEWQPLLDYCAGNPLTLRVLVGQAVKVGLRGKQRIADFVENIRSGEQRIEDADEKQGRDKSLGASLNYGFREAFDDEELPIIALLHLFQGTIDVDSVHLMGAIGEHSLSEVMGKSKEQLTGLLLRAKESGLLTQIGPAYFTIHPALPWFLRQLFVRHYDGQSGRSSSEAAFRSWVEAVGATGNFYQQQFERGNRRFMDLLELEEPNLLQARRLARRNGWWLVVISCMQGLSAVYLYSGRAAEWARLVEEIRPEFCTADNEPVAGREDGYTHVMSYRLQLAQVHERDPAKAAVLQEKTVGWDRQQAASVLALPAEAPLDKKQRNVLRSLGVSECTLGIIFQEEGNSECVQHFQECIRIFRRIADKAAEASGEYNLGHAYKDVPGIRDLDAAEAAYQRAMELHGPNDDLTRALCIKQIGMVHHERFRDAVKRDDPMEVALRHAQTALSHYHDALRLCPSTALTHLAPIHNSLGNLYSQVGDLDSAREHYEKDAQYEEKVGNHFGAGQTRFNMSLMYVRAFLKESHEPSRRTNFLRARAYAEAALRDFRHYQGRAAEGEARTQGLLDLVNQELAKLPE